MSAYLLWLSVDDEVSPIISCGSCVSPALWVRIILGSHALTLQNLLWHVPGPVPLLLLLLLPGPSHPALVPPGKPFLGQSGHVLSVFP